MILVTEVGPGPNAPPTEKEDCSGHKTWGEFIPLLASIMPAWLISVTSPTIVVHSNMVSVTRWILLLGNGR